MGLEQLRHGKEDLGGLGGGNDLALVHQVKDLGENRDAFLGLDLGLMEDPGLLEHGALVDVGELVDVCRQKKTRQRKRGQKGGDDVEGKF